MKLFKKFLSVAATLALVVAAVPANVKAASDVIDFEDGNVPSAISMKTDDGGDQSPLSVVDFNGSKALFVDVQDAAAVPKVLIDALALVGADNLETVRGFSVDVSVVNPTGDLANWNGGGCGAMTGADGSVWYNEPSQWTAEDYEDATTDAITYTMKFVDGMGFTNGATASGFLFMKWAGANDMYLDNIKLLDADGNPVALNIGAAEASTDDAAATDAAATDVPKTGATSYALFFLLGAAAMATGAVVVRRRSVEE